MVERSDRYVSISSVVSKVNSESRTGSWDWVPVSGLNGSSYRRYLEQERAAIRGRMVITYNGDRWEHTEKLLPSEQIEEMTFPDERWKKF